MAGFAKSMIFHVFSRNEGLSVRQTDVFGVQFMTFVEVGANVD